jgi:CDP-glucose 4,6-dehydratase
VEGVVSRGPMMKNSFWKDRNVFITGCTGLLGSWLTQSLVDEGANVVGLVRDIVPRSNLNSSGFSDRINIVHGDVADYRIVERAINEYEIDTVFHLAAQTIVTIANRNPIPTFESNIKGTWNLLEACRNARHVSRIVVASSDKAYGDQERLPYDERTPLEGRHPYDVSKSCADLICQSYYETYRLPVCVTRCGNFYGGGDLNYNRIVPGTIKSILNGQPPVIRGDGKSIRDYFYIEDGVKAYMLLAAKMDSETIRGEAFNFSNELQVTVTELVNKIVRLMGSDLNPVILNKASNEIVHQYLSAKKAREVLGWEPSFTLEKGLSKTIDWYENNVQITREH